MDSLRLLFSINQSDRLKKEKAALDRIDDPKLPRHTVYQGDRSIQQLGQDTIENGVVLNNQSVAIGETVLPLAKGNVLRRVDKTNGGALLGTAYREALENDYDANRNRRSSELGRNGGDEPSNPSSPNNPNNNGAIGNTFPPPFGCVPPPKECFWSSDPNPPQGFQSHGDAVVNENALPLYLHCKLGASVPANLGCDFLDTPKFSCSGGVCSPDPNGIYTSLAQCEAALVRSYYVEISGVYLDNFGVFQSGGVDSKTVSQAGLTLETDGIAGFALTGEPAYWYKIGGARFTAAGWRLGAVSITTYNLISSSCP
jgi:hypothetical protein